jgi:hypothetical protein
MMLRKGCMSSSTICLFLCAIGGGRAVAAGKPESCEGLDNIIAKSAATLQCQRNDDCLSLDCNATDLAGFGAVLLGNSAFLQCQRSDDCLFLDCNATSIAGFGAVLHLSFTPVTNHLPLNCSSKHLMAYHLWGSSIVLIQ